MARQCAPHGEERRRIIHGTGAGGVIQESYSVGAGEEHGFPAAVRNRSSALFPAVTDWYDAPSGGGTGIGTTPRLGVGPGRDFEFIVIPSPIGPYYPGKFHCTSFIVNRYVDRAAPYGTGQFKVGGNYASSFRATEAAHAMGMDCIFLDAKYHRYIDECSAANFIGIRRVAGDSQPFGTVEYLTPKSSAILPSITNDSLMALARERGYKVTRRRIRLEELADMSEAAACGTACVISPIDRVLDTERGVTYSFGSEPGPVLSELFHALRDIQFGRAEDKHGWCEIFEILKS